MLLVFRFFPRAETNNKKSYFIGRRCKLLKFNRKNKYQILIIRSKFHMKISLVPVDAVRFNLVYKINFVLNFYNNIDFMWLGLPE